MALSSTFTQYASEITKFVKNKVDVLHVRLTELHAVHQNLPCYLLTCLPTNNYGVLCFPLF